jgi:hypothetical protein
MFGMAALAFQTGPASGKVTAVAQWLKTPGIHCYVAGSIPVVTPRYSSNKIRNALWSTKKRRKKKVSISGRHSFEE